MNSAARANRPSKRDVITLDDDDAANQQPAMKTAKIEEAEPVPTPEVLGLRQQLLKAEDTTQRAIRRAGELQERVEILENLIDKKPVIDGACNVEELKKSMADLKKGLEFEKQRSREEVHKWEEKFNRACRATRDAELRAERAENLLESKQDLVLDGSVNADEQQKKIIDLTSQLEEERGRSKDLLRQLNERDSERVKDRERIDQLTGQLLQQLQKQPQVQPVQQPPRQQPQQPQPEPPLQKQQLQPVRQRPQKKLPAVTGRKDLIAILQLCRDQNAISIDDAINRMLPLHLQADKCKLIRTMYGCEACKIVQSNDPNILGHFFSKNHVNKVRLSGAGVSPAALQAWIVELSRAARPNQGSGTAAAPAATGLKDAVAAAIDKLTGQQTGQQLQQLQKHPLLQTPQQQPQMQPPPMQSHQPSHQMQQKQKLQPVQQKLSQQLPASYGAPPNKTVVPRRDLLAILQLYRSEDAVPVKDAARRIKPLYTPVDKDNLLRADFECEACGVSRPNDNILDHFLFNMHIKKVRESGAGVSPTAVQAWIVELSRAARMRQSSGAAAATDWEAAAAANRQKQLAAAAAEKKKLKLAKTTEDWTKILAAAAAGAAAVAAGFPIPAAAVAAGVPSQKAAASVARLPPPPAAATTRLPPPPVDPRVRPPLAAAAAKLSWKPAAGVQSQNAAAAARFPPSPNAVAAEHPSPSAALAARQPPIRAASAAPAAATASLPPPPTTFDPRFLPPPSSPAASLSPLPDVAAAMQFLQPAAAAARFPPHPPPPAAMQFSQPAAAAARFLAWSAADASVRIPPPPAAFDPRLTPKVATAASPAAAAATLSWTSGAAAAVLPPPPAPPAARVPAQTPLAAAAARLTPPPPPPPPAAMLLLQPVAAAAKLPPPSAAPAARMPLPPAHQLKWEVGRKSALELVVRNIPLQISPFALQSIFSALEGCLRFNMPMNADGSHLGFGFAHFITERDTSRAFDLLRPTRESGGMVPQGMEDVPMDNVYVIESDEDEEESMEPARRQNADSGKDDQSAAAAAPAATTAAESSEVGGAEMEEGEIVDD